ncbi:MAG: hypothetical protein IJA89_03125 [Clostridia bacterium]|nr:hypothetical protein [Clostridia bacterium]
MEKKLAIDWVRNAVIGCMALLGILTLAFPLLSIETGTSKYSENGFYFLSFKDSQLVKGALGGRMATVYGVSAIAQLCMGIVATGLTIYTFFTKKRATKKSDVTVIVLTALSCLLYFTWSTYTKISLADSKNVTFQHLAVSSGESAYIPLLLWLVLLVGYIVVKTVGKTNK